MTAYGRSWAAMTAALELAKGKGVPREDWGREVDKAIICGRYGGIYKTWLQARRNFFARHQIPLPRARKPEPVFGLPEC